MMRVGMVALRRSLLLLAMFALMAGSVRAAIPVTVVNHSFEDDPGYTVPGLAGPLVGEGPLTGWTPGGGPATGGSSWGSQDLPGAGFQADDGEWRLLLGCTLGGTPVSATTIYQVLSSNLAADTVYSLTVAIGGFAENNGGAYDLALYAGDTELVAGSATGYVTDDFLDVTLTYDPTTSLAAPTVGAALTVVLIGRANVLDQAWSIYDNVRVTAELIPEPGTLAMLGLGAITFLAFRGRRLV